jgi:hypothetical protein
MKYLYIALILIVVSCEKKDNIKQDSVEKYLVNYHYTHSYPHKIQTISQTNIPVTITDKFDTIIEIEVNYSEIPNSIIEINGLKKFESNMSFEYKIINPILTDERNLVISDYFLQNSTNGFLKNDSIYYFYSTNDEFPYNYSIEGIKIH